MCCWWPPGLQGAEPPWAPAGMALLCRNLQITNTVTRCIKIVYLDLPKFLKSWSKPRVFTSIFSCMLCRRLIFSSPSSCAAINACCILLNSFSFWLLLVHSFRCFCWFCTSRTRATNDNIQFYLTGPLWGWFYLNSRHPVLAYAK